ncbi:MAG: M23 family metallopeptidase [Cryobacterium sp.]|nr:M23 family metallopeptidase [Cryobacterium sp.]
MNPWLRPAPGRISSGFGPRKSVAGSSSVHQGVDIACSVGTPVVASAAGVVAFAGLAGGFGNLIRVDAGDAHELYDAHLSYIAVRYGQYVAQGQVIAASGGARGAPGSGTSTGPHLHHEHRINGKPFDPVPFWDLTIGDPMSALTIVRILRKGIGEHFMYVSPTTVRVTKELSTATAEDRAFEHRVARALAAATGAAEADPPLVDDSHNGSWYLRNQLAGLIAGMPPDYPLAPDRPYTAHAPAIAGDFTFTGKATPA